MPLQYTSSCSGALICRVQMRKHRSAANQAVYPSISGTSRCFGFSPWEPNTQVGFPGCSGAHWKVFMKASVLQGKLCPWVPPALQAPCLAPFRKRFPRWAQRTTTGLTIFTSGCQRVAGLSDSKQICMQESKPTWQTLFWLAG